MASAFLLPRPIAMLLMSVIALCAQDQPQKAGSSEAHLSRTIGEKRRVNGVSNFGVVAPNLLRGAQPSPEGLKALADMGVKIVVDARGDRTDSEGKQAKQLGMQYVPIPWRCPFPKDEVFARFLKVVRDNPDKKIFVHCRLGDDRTGMMVAAYRMAVEGWTADEALDEMQQFGYTGVHHYLLCPRLSWYERDFPEHLKKNPALRGETKDDK